MLTRYVGGLALTVLFTFPLFAAPCPEVLRAFAAGAPSARMAALITRAHRMNARAATVEGWDGLSEMLRSEASGIWRVKNEGLELYLLIGRSAGVIHICIVDIRSDGEGLARLIGAVTEEVLRQEALGTQVHTVQFQAFHVTNHRLEILLRDLGFRRSRVLALTDPYAATILKNAPKGQFTVRLLAVLTDIFWPLNSYSLRLQRKYWKLLKGAGGR